MSNELYRQMIVDHSKNPRNFGKLENKTHSCVGNNSLCGDKIEIQMYIKNDIIEKILFTGVGCAISQASASLLTQMLKGKHTKEIEILTNLFRLMTTKKISEEQLLQMEKLSVFRSISAYPSRIKCAVLAWHTALGAFLKRETEEMEDH